MGSLFSSSRRRSSAPRSAPANQASTQQQAPPSAAAQSSAPSAATSATTATEDAGVRITVDRADTGELPDTRDPDTILETPPLFARGWQHQTEAKEDCYSFTMMNFNILADGLSGARSDVGSRDKTFVRVPLEYLEWDFRGPRIVEEILRWSPDVLCMEECDKFDFLLDKLQAGGYVGRFKDKDWSPCLRIGDGLPPDGVAIFWKQEKFQLVGDHQTVQERHRINVGDSIAKAALKVDEEHHDPNTGVAAVRYLGQIPGLVTETGDVDLNEIQNMFKKDGPRTVEFARRDMLLDPAAQYVSRPVFEEWIQKASTPVSLLVRLRPLDPLARGAELGIVATHLVSAKELTGEIHRQRQLKALMHDEGYKQLLDGTQTFLGCDLNAAPVDSKGYPPLAYRYIVGTPVAADVGHEYEVKVDVFEHPFKSAMRGDTDSEIVYSTWKHREKTPGHEVEDKHTIDYLFYPPVGWSVVKTLDIPSEIDVSQERRRVSHERHMGEDTLPSALPSVRYPSDHFSIFAQFQMSS